MASPGAPKDFYSHDVASSEAQSKRRKIIVVSNDDEIIISDAEVEDEIVDEG